MRCDDAAHLGLQACPWQRFAFAATIAPAAAKLLEAAIAIVTENALRADTVDCAEVEPEPLSFARRRS
jgi:hypothetical protein